MTEHPIPSAASADESGASGTTSATSEVDLTPATMTAAFAFLRQARQDLAKRGAALDQLQKDWDAEQERFSALFNAAPDGYFVTDALGVIRDSSRAAASLLHILPPHLTGKPLINFIAMEDRPALRRSLLSLKRDAAGGGDADIVEFVRVMPRNAPVFEALLRITSIPHRETGEVEGLQWLLCDISKRVRAETERYRLLFDAVEDYAVFLLDDQGRITSWNRGAEKTFGWRERDVLGQYYGFLFPTEHASDAEKELNVARATGRYLEEGWMAGRSKRPFWTQGVLIALPSSSKGEGGHRAGFAKILRDMTDKQREAEELRLREARLSLALQAARAASWERNIDTGEMIWSQGFRDLSGISQTAPPTYETWLLSVHSADRADADRRLIEAVEKNLPLTSEYRAEQNSNGQTRWLLLLGQPITNAQGQVVRMVGVLQDVTDRKESEAALEARVTKRTRELAQANERIVKETTARHALMQKIVTAQEDERRRISRELHDTMGQHLTAFSLNLRVLEDTYPPESNGKPILTRLRQVADELSHDLHQMAVDLRPTALDDLGLANALQGYVENWTERVGIQAEFGSSGFAAPTGGEVLTLTPVVETTLYRIAQEALNNIARHSDATRAEVTLSCYADIVVLVIEDNGRGFDADQVMHHVDINGLPTSGGTASHGSPRKTASKFKPQNSDAKQKERGTSQSSGRLGIMGMAERAQTVGGTFTLESEPGRGTSIFVRVPLRSVL